MIASDSDTFFKFMDKKSWQINIPWLLETGGQELTDTYGIFKTFIRSFAEVYHPLVHIITLNSCLNKNHFQLGKIFIFTKIYWSAVSH